MARPSSAASATYRTGAPASAAQRDIACGHHRRYTHLRGRVDMRQKCFRGAHADGPATQWRLNCTARMPCYEVRNRGFAANPQLVGSSALSAVPRRISSAATSSAATDSTTATARPTPRVSRSTRSRSGSGGGPGRNRERQTEHLDARSAHVCRVWPSVCLQVGFSARRLTSNCRFVTREWLCKPSHVQFAQHRLRYL